MALFSSQRPYRINKKKRYEGHKVFSFTRIILFQVQKWDREQSICILKCLLIGLVDKSVIGNNCLPLLSYVQFWIIYTLKKTVIKRLSGYLVAWLNKFMVWMCLNRNLDKSLVRIYLNMHFFVLYSFFSVPPLTSLIRIRSYTIIDFSFNRWKDLQWAVNFLRMEHFWWQEVQMAKCFSTTTILLGLFVLCRHIEKLVWVQYFTQYCHHSLRLLIGLEKSRSGNNKQNNFSSIKELGISEGINHDMQCDICCDVL